MEAVDIDEKAMAWAGDVIGNARERELNFDKRKPSEIPLPSFLLEKSEKSEDDPQEVCKSSERERASRNGSTVVDISIPPPSFKPISLSLSRSSLSKTPKQVFF